MKTERICPSCQKPLPEGAPQELCPECLMKAGFGSSAGQPVGNPRFVPPSVAELARLFPQLEVLDLIGQGGMGAVYKARQPGLDRLVALKVLPPEATATAGFAERFTREARALAKLNHPNVVSVYDFGQAGPLHYFLMEYVDGLNLRQLVAGGRLSPREALRIVPQICDALQFAHDEGIVHRDIKPENVLVDKRGRVKVADFGLAKLLGAEPESARLTGAKDVMGTPHYMAPEQMERPDAVDHRADIYSLGVVFYELLTGELPLGKFAPPSKKVAVDVRLDEVVLHTLEKEPERRYQHVSDVKSDVETITHAAGPDAGTTSAAPQRTAEKSTETALWHEARQQVKGPAIGLVVAGLLNWVGIPVVLFAAYLAVRREAGTILFMVLLPLAALVLSSVMLVAGFKMKRLQAYWLAVTGSILAVLVTPGNLVGLPIGIWSLVVLSQKRVRNCFGKDEPPASTEPASAVPASGGGWKLAMAVLAAVILLCALPVGALVTAMVLPALHKAKAVSMNLRQFEPTQEMVVSIVGENGQGEALDLDSGQKLALPFKMSKQMDAGQAATWFDDKGIDLLVGRDRDHFILATPVANEMKLISVPGEAWVRNIGLPSLAESASEARRGGELWVIQALPPNPTLPLTYSFQTAQGREGFLQVTSLSVDAATASLRFKLKR